MQAEFDNFRKRTLREKMELVQSGSAECVKNLLPLMDDLQRALEAIEKSNDLEALREGVKLIAQKFTGNAQETECEGDRGARTGVGYRSPRGGGPFRCREGEEGQDRRCGTARLQDGRQGVAFCEKRSSESNGRFRLTGAELLSSRTIVPSVECENTTIEKEHPAGNRSPAFEYYGRKRERLLRSAWRGEERQRG